ncbi:MAG: YceI family protein [Ignavibacterium sp.]|jgi:polyisoprenoid-binding protein YceI|uniref:YceI family protein n=1 Tax=Ignavibacterium sp. TaxID=2651167 RepID=UPI003299639B
MATWKIDPAHSEIKFKVKHLVVSTVTGQFKVFDATVESEKSDFSDAKISFWADVNSIDTRNEQRDAHLKSADFFDAVNHPKIVFESKAINKKSDNEYEVVGDLTIRGVTKEIKLNVTYNGTVKGFGGGEVAGFEMTGKLNRFDYGLQWNALTEAGGIVVGDEVKIEISCELTKVNG